jgi:cytoskeletal protein CcmA (bactofilin family)
MGIIGPSLIVTGEVASDEDLLVEGRVRGRITVRGGALTIGEDARVDAQVRGVRVLIKGRVQGGIFASERIELHASAIVEGNLSANQVVVHDGARFRGGIDMAKRTIAARIARFRAAQPAAS